MSLPLIGLLFLVGLAGMLRCDNLIKKIIALNLLNTAVIVLFVHYGARTGSEAPIILEGTSDIVDPIPQGLMLTAIVVGICITAVALAMAVKLHRDYGTLSVRQIENKLRRDDE